MILTPCSPDASLIQTCGSLSEHGVTHGWGRPRSLPCWVHKGDREAAKSFAKTIQMGKEPCSNARETSKKASVLTHEAVLAEWASAQSTDHQEPANLPALGKSDVCMQR
uniref:Uncharacterized protein n=1 Tax=Micrurus spixii TaxID=129469 RepID=A0A2D4NBS9_9SAUR